MTTKLVNGQVVDITGTPEETALLAEWADNEPGVGAKWTADQAAALTKLREAAKATFADAGNDPQALAKACRAFALIVLEQTHNMLATKVNAILTAVDNATSLANLKSAVALIVDAPTYTPAQLKAAIRNKIDSGDVD